MGYECSTRLKRSRGTGQDGIVLQGGRVLKLNPER